MNNRDRRQEEKLYICDEEMFEEQKPARRLTQKLNTMDRSDFKGIAEVVKELFGKSGKAFVNPPFYCDYGFNIEVGDGFFCNYNCTMLDVAKIKIGDNCLFAPNVAIYTAGHPIDPEIRSTGYEYGIGVTIGNNCWIGGNAVICPGVTIGDNCVIGAGSVVTRDIPSNSVAVGNPCRVIREVSERDKEFYFRNRKIDDEAQADIRRILSDGAFFPSE